MLHAGKVSWLGTLSFTFPTATLCPLTRPPAAHTLVERRFAPEFRCPCWCPSPGRLSIHMRLSSPKNLQAFVDVADADALLEQAREPGFGDADAVVFHHDLQVARDGGCAPGWSRRPLCSKGRGGCCFRPAAGAACWGPADPASPDRFPSRSAACRRTGPFRWPGSRR